MTKKHGFATPERKSLSGFNSWVHLRQRCGNPDNPAYDRYGGRGIKVCDRWQESFENFYADMGPKPSTSHSIERKNNDGDYEPGNCKWATKTEQANNRRRRTGNLKFSAAQVLEIRALEGKLSTRKIGELYGCSSMTVSSIWRRETWAHIGG